MRHAPRRVWTIPKLLAALCVLEAIPLWGEEPPAPEPLAISVREAILVGLENNRQLRVERINPHILQTFEEEHRADFDPILSAKVATGRARATSRTSSGKTTADTDSTTGGLFLDEFLPTGTSISAELTGTHTNVSPGTDPMSRARAGLTVTQSLLRGLGLGPNLASLRQARLDTQASEYELRGFVEALVAEIETTYWAYALAQRRIEIFTASLELAERQLKETEERVKIGRLARTELAAAQAEVALRREDLINARSTLAATRLALLRLINPPGPGLWEREIILKDQPEAPMARLEAVGEHVAVALRLRPDLNEARTRLARGELEVVKTRSGLLPKLDVFITLGKSGYANAFGEAVRNVGGTGYDVSTGLTFEYALGNREPEARHRRATLSRQQAAEAVENLAQLVELDVRTAYIEVGRAREQVAATAATRALQEETFRAEVEKFRVGRSTSFQVAQAQRNLVASQIAEIQAVVNLLSAFVNLYRLEGSLLERRGLSVAR